MKPKMNQNEKFFEMVLFIIALILAIIGVLSVYSAGSYNAAIVQSNPFIYVFRQGLFLIVSLVACFMCLKLKYKWFLDQKLQTKAVIGMVILLIILMFLPAIKGAKGWISLGFFSVQPAEFAKLILIWVTALYFSVVRYLPDMPIVKHSSTLHYYISKHHQELTIIIPYMFIIGLVLAQPDTGGAMIMALTIGLTWLASGLVNFKKAMTYVGIGIVVIMAVSLLVILILGPKDYRVIRLTSFINPFSQANYDKTYQVRNSFYALAHGGLFGVGIGNSVQKTGYLPENRTDFILSIIGEEMGMIGVLVVVGLLLLLVTLILRRSMTVQRTFDQFVLLGIGMMFLVQIVFNVGGITSLIPLTGITLPFISYGGSSLLLSFISIGIVLKISIYDRTTPIVDDIVVIDEQQKEEEFEI